MNNRYHAAGDVVSDVLARNTLAHMANPTVTDLAVWQGWDDAAKCDRWRAYNRADALDLIVRWFGAKGVPAPILAETHRATASYQAISDACLTAGIASVNQTQYQQAITDRDAARASLDDANHQIASLQSQHVSDQNQITDLQHQLSQVQTPQQAQDTIASLQRQLDDAKKAAALASSGIGGGTIVAGVLGVIGGIAVGRRQR